MTNLLRDTGGLLVLEATSLLRIVLQNAESVLLHKNLKSCNQKKLVSTSCSNTYLDEKVLIKILASGVLLGLVLYSTSLDQIDTLKHENSR